MKKQDITLLVMLLHMIFILTAAAQCTGWANTASGVNSNTAYGITLDEENNSYVAGYYNGPTTFGNITLNDNGMYVVKYDSLGSQLWVKAFPGSFFGFPASINYSNAALFFVTTFISSATFGNITLNTAGYYGIAVVKLNTDGDVLWAKTFSGTATSLGYGIYNTSSGKVLITGKYKGTLTMGSYTLTGSAVLNGEYNIYISDLDDSSGDVLWAQSSVVQANFNNGRGYAIRTDIQGNIVLSGYYSNILQFGNQTLNNSGDLYAYAPYVAKFDSNGTCLWINGGIGPATFDNVYALTTDSLSNIYFGCPIDTTTIFSGETFHPEKGNFVIGKYNSSGALLWAKQWGSHVTDSTSLVTVLHLNRNGTLTAYGWGRNEMIFDQDTLTSVGGEDIFSANFDTNGNYLSSFITGGIYGEFFHAAAFDEYDHAYIAGSFFGNTTTLGDFSLHGEAPVDSNFFVNIFVWKNCPAGIGTTVQTVQENQITVFPNPSNGLFFIAGVHEETYLIRNIEGTVISQGKISDHEAIDLSGIASGIYLLSLIDKNFMYQTKIFIQ
ncbi:MAG: T9SS type A sorting domain-containing protein [Chitinophagales bacterium]|nr:T9SS type A sorting domain-containing protein [Chitinophagales bacterium]